MIRIWLPKRIQGLVICSLLVSNVALAKKPKITGNATTNEMAATETTPEEATSEQAAVAEPAAEPSDAPSAPEAPLREGDKIISGRNEPPANPPSESPTPIYDPEWNRRQDEKTFNLRMQGASGHGSDRNLASEPMAIPGPPIVSTGEVFTAPDGRQWEPVQITPEEAAKYPRNSDGVVIIIAPENQAISNSIVDGPSQSGPRSAKETLSAATNRAVPSAISNKNAKELFDSSSVTSEKEIRQLGIFVATPKEAGTPDSTPEAVKGTPKTYNNPFKSQNVPNKIAINLENSLTVGNPQGATTQDRVAGLRLKSLGSQTDSKNSRSEKFDTGEDAAFRSLSNQDTEVTFPISANASTQTTRSRAGLILILLSLVGFGLYGFWLYRQRKPKREIPSPTIEDATSATTLQRPHKP